MAPNLPNPVDARILDLRDAQTLDIVQEDFNEAGRQGERSVGVVRLLVALLALARHLWFNFQEMLSGSTKDTLTCGVIVLAAMLSLPSLRLRRQADWASLRRFMMASITVDATLVFGTLVFLVVWPPVDYTGLLSRPYYTILIVTVLATGLRLSRSAAVYGLLVNLLVFFVLLAVDNRLNTNLAANAPGSIAYVVTMMCAAGVVSVVVAGRARALVLQSVKRLLEASRIRARLGAYMSQEVAEAALQATEMKMGGNRQDVAVLFSDLRGFTSYSELLDPQQLVSQLNAYLQVMVTAIRAEGGVVDKYIGDAIMAVFGAPRTRGDDAARAIRAAARMQRMLVEHNVTRVAQGLPALVQGIGVHYGPVVAGNVGTPDQAQYTIVGDTVNLASRLESMTKEQKVPVLISQAVLDAAGNEHAPRVRLCGTVNVRGRETSVVVYTLAGDDDAQPAAATA